MAELVNGTYAVISVASSLALDVRADSSSLVTLATPDFADEQVWNVVKKDSVYLDDTNYRGAWVIKSSTTGKILSPAGYANVAGTAVRQENYDPETYNYDDEPEEDPEVTDDPKFYPTWVIEDTGSTFVFENDTYTKYTIRRPTVSSDTGYGTIGVSMAASGSSVSVATYASTTAQQWIFVPVSLLSEDGLYTIRSAANTSLGFDVSSKSTSNGANLLLYTIADATNQQFKVAQFGEYYRFLAAHSSKAVDISGNTPKNGASIVQYTPNQSDYSSSIKVTGYTTLKLSYTLSSTSTEFKVSFTRLDMSNSRKGGLSEKSTIKVNYASMTPTAFSNTRKSGPSANTNQTKNVNKSSKTSALSLSKFNFVFNRQNSNVSGKINMQVSIKGTSSGARLYQKTLAISVTVPAKNSGNIDVTDDSQLWKIIDAGFVDQGSTIYQAYMIAPKSNDNFRIDASGGVKKSAKIITWQSNGKDNQKWLFVRTVMDVTDIDSPGAIRQTSFTRTGAGVITVSNLTFQSRYSAFIARYKVRTYVNGNDKYSDTKWMNLADDSTVQEGWGEAGKPTFEYAPVNNIIRVPFSKEYKLNSTNRAVDLIFEMRAFVENYGENSYPAQGSVTQSTIRLSLLPDISVKSSSIYADTSANEIGIVTNLEDSTGEGCQILRGRLLDSTGIPISDWISRSSMQLIHTADASLYRFPQNGETIQFEYSMLCANGTFVQGKVSRPYNFNTGSEISVRYLDDDSCTAIVSIPTATYAFCLVSVPDIDLKKLYVADKITESGRTAWRIAPPLNQDFEITVFTSEDNVNWRYSTTTGRINSHLFIWNWTSDGSTEALDSFASIIVNVDDPPQQTRSYTSGISFSKPMSRRYPVGFADITIEADLSIEGTAVDTDANYYSANPIPSHTTTEYLMSLVSLSGKGIHPIYRTPYGDWYTVGIEGVNLTKKSIGYSSASITQRAIKD